MQDLSKYTINKVYQNNCAEILPEFGSIEQTCRIFGLGRTKLYSYIKRGFVRSVCLREKGKSTGRRLVHLQSVREFLTAQLPELRK